MPTVVGFDTAAGNAQFVASLAWADVITNTPSGATGILASDVALIEWNHPNTVTETDLPEGFTLLDSQTDGADVLSVYKRVCAGGESGIIGSAAFPGVKFGTDAFARQTWTLSVYRGYENVDVVSKAADAGTDATHTLPAATPTRAGPGVLALSGERLTTGSSDYSSVPAGFTKLCVAATVATAGSFCGIAYKGSAGNMTATDPAGVAINPGNLVHNVAAADAPAMTILLLPPASGDTDLGSAFFAA